jgi:hypothetical protein
MIPEPSGRLTRGRCPCCHNHDVRLYPCLGCDWAAATERQESKERLELLSPGSGHNAYNPTGCRVCMTCRGQVAQNPFHCPLRVFHDLAPPPQRGRTPSGWDRLPAAAAFWERWLRERGWPEVTESYWHRLVAFLKAERQVETE